MLYSLFKEVTLLSKVNKQMEQKLETSHGNRPGSLSRWLKLHPKAIEFIDLWLRKRIDGTSSWTVPEVQNELEVTYALPAFSHNALIAWIKRNRRQPYEQGK